MTETADAPAYDYRRAGTRLAKGLALAAATFLISALFLWLLDAVASNPSHESLARALSGALFVVAGFVLGVTSFHRLWLPWLPDRRVLADMYGTLIVAFASLTLCMITVHFLFLFSTGARAEPTPEPRTPSGSVAESRESAAATPELDDNDAVWATTEYFLWNFSDAIPVIKLPETVNWRLDWTYVDHASGWLLLIYKLLVILPILAVIARSLKAPPEPQPLEPEPM